VKSKAGDFVGPFLKPQFKKELPEDYGWFRNEMSLPLQLLQSRLLSSLE